MINKTLSEMLDINLKKLPELYLLNMMNEDVEKKYGKVLFYAITLARIALARMWKTDGIPDRNEWLMSLYEAVEMDKLTLILRGETSNTIEQIWGRVLEYLEKARNI